MKAIGCWVSATSKNPRQPPVKRNSLISSKGSGCATCRLDLEALPSIFVLFHFQSEWRRDHFWKGETDNFLLFLWACVHFSMWITENRILAVDKVIDMLLWWMLCCCFVWNNFHHYVGNSICWGMREVTPWVFSSSNRPPMVVSSNKAGKAWLGLGVPALGLCVRNSQKSLISSHYVAVMWIGCSAVGFNTAVSRYLRTAFLCRFFRYSGSPEQISV